MDGIVFVLFCRAWAWRFWQISSVICVVIFGVVFWASARERVLLIFSGMRGCCDWFRLRMRRSGAVCSIFSIVVKDAEQVAQMRFLRVVGEGLEDEEEDEG